MIIIVTLFIVILINLATIYNYNYKKIIEDDILFRKKAKETLDKMHSDMIKEDNERRKRLGMKLL